MTLFGGKRSLARKWTLIDLQPASGIDQGLDLLNPIRKRNRKSSWRAPVGLGINGKCTETDFQRQRRVTLNHAEHLVVKVLLKRRV